SELVLQPPHIRVLWRQLDLVALPAGDRLDRLARLFGRLVFGAAAQVDDAGERARDLARGIAPRDVDRDARGLRVPEPWRLAAVVVLERQDHAGIPRPPNDRDRHPETPRRVFDARPGQAEGIHLDRLTHTVVHWQPRRAAPLDHVRRRARGRLCPPRDLATLGALADLRRDRHPEEDRV